MGAASRSLPPRVLPPIHPLPLGGPPGKRLLWTFPQPGASMVSGFHEPPSEGLASIPSSPDHNKLPMMQLGVDERSVNCIAKNQPHTSSHPIYEDDPKRKRKHLMALKKIK